MLIPLENTGECIYLGCSNDGCRTFNSVVEFNYCHDTHTDGSGSGAAGYQIKTGSYNNIVRHNVCKNTPGVCVLLYDDYDRGVNIVEGNVVLGVQNDNGIQVTSGVIVRFNNVVIGWNASKQTKIFFYCTNSYLLHRRRCWYLCIYESSQNNAS